MRTRIIEVIFSIESFLPESKKYAARSAPLLCGWEAKRTALHGSKKRYLHPGDPGVNSASCFHDNPQALGLRLRTRRGAAFRSFGGIPFTGSLGPDRPCHPPDTRITAPLFNRIQLWVYFIVCRAVCQMFSEKSSTSSSSKSRRRQTFRASRGQGAPGGAGRRR